MKAYKNKTIIPPIELCRDDGTVVDTVQVLTDYIVLRNRLMADLGKLEQAKQRGANEQDLGEIGLKLIADMYGDDGLDKLLKFYENDYTAMLQTVSEHIAFEVKPALERIADERVKAAKKAGKVSWKKGLFNRK